MSGPGDAPLVDVLAGLGGGPPRTGVLHVVAVPRFDPTATSLRAAVVVAGADVVRRPDSLPPDVLAGLLRADVALVDGGIERLLPGDLSMDRVEVQLVPAAMQTAPALVHHVQRLRDEGVVVEVVASTGTVEAALVGAGVGVGIPREVEDGRLDVAVLAADRPDLSRWRSGLTRRGYLGHTPVRLVLAAGTARQRVRTIDLAELGDVVDPEGPVVAVVGDDATGPADWRDDLPLRGVRVLNPRAPHQAAALSGRVRSLGGEPVEAPLLRITPGDEAAMAAAVRRLAAGDYEVLGLTSPNGVDALAAALTAAGLDARALAGADRVACVGPGTAARLAARLRVAADLVPDTSTTDELAAALGRPRAGGRVLLPRADRATAVLRDGLLGAGWQVDDVTAYRTDTVAALPEGLVAALAEGAVPIVPVLSSSMASALVAVGRERGIAAAIVSIGPVTSATLREQGVEPYREAATHDLDGLVQAVADVGRELPRPT